MKKTLSVLLLSAMLMSFLGCNRRDPAPSTDSVTVPSAEQTAPSFVHSEPTRPSASLPTVAPTDPYEPPPAIHAANDQSFVRVQDYIPDIFVDLRYAGEDNFMGKAIYEFRDAYLRYGTVKKLLKVQAALREVGLSLKIWDAFRPAGVQFQLWDASKNPTYMDDPAVRYSSHTMGDTVDVTLVDLQGKPVTMPSDYDVFSKLGDRDYADCSPEAKENAELLEKIMKQYGFSGYKEEWWHFSDTDTYSTDTNFDPAVVSLWIANCNDYITLRAKASTDSKQLARIKAGEAVILLGWYDKFAFVDYQGVQGFVASDYLMPETKWVPEELLSIVRVYETYTYEQMKLDIVQLVQKYPKLVKVGSIGKSELGKDLPLLVVGSPDAKYDVLIHASMHAREHITTWTVMAMVEYWLSRGMEGCENVRFHIIPMVNPDGVYLSQTADFTEKQLAIYQWDKSMGYTYQGKQKYANTWKANGLGVDINRNFDAAWKATSSRAKPSSERYKGEAPLSAAETAAIAKYTVDRMPDVTISCHSTGSVIYYEYGKKTGPNALSKSLGQTVEAICGYRLVGQGGLDAGGFKDWCIDTLQIPSLTIEMGCGAAPVQPREIYSVFARNLRLMPAIQNWLEMQ